MNLEGTHQKSGIQEHRLLPGIEDQNIEFLGVHMCFPRNERSQQGHRSPTKILCHSASDQLSNETNRDCLALTVFTHEFFDFN